MCLSGTVLQIIQERKEKCYRIQSTYFSSFTLFKVSMGLLESTIMGLKTDHKNKKALFYFVLLFWHYSSFNTYLPLISRTITFGKKGPAFPDNKKYSPMNEYTSTLVLSLFILFLLDYSICRCQKQQIVNSIKLLCKGVVSRHWNTLKRPRFFSRLPTYVSRE